MNAYMHPQDRAEEFGDGLSNDYQRALEVSRLRLDSDPDGERIEAHLKAGRFVAVAYVTAYCSITDAICGEIRTIIAHGPTRESVQAALEPRAESLDMDDARVVILPMLPPERVVAQAVEGDDCPF